MQRNGQSKLQRFGRIVIMGTMPIYRSVALFIALSTAWVAAHSRCVAEERSSALDRTFFENRIRPLLAENCYKCHSATSEKLKGGLMLDSRERLLKGGESGTVLVPGDPEKSLLIKAVRYTDKDLQMPPKNKKLSDRQIADLTAWVKVGAPWPAEENTKSAGTRAGTFEITDKDRAYWALQPIKRPTLPPVKQKTWVTNPIDAFVLAPLEAKGLPPNPPASKRELLRRVYFDLIGLPPTPEEVAAFEKDRSAEAYERVIDHLLSLPQYGEGSGIVCAHAKPAFGLVTGTSSRPTSFFTGSSHVIQSPLSSWVP